MEEATPQPPSPAPLGPPAPRSARAGFDAWRESLRHRLALRLAYAQARFRAPAWWVALRERIAARREKLAWWWEGYALRVLRPCAESVRRRFAAARSRCADAWHAWSAWCGARTAPLRSWWADRAAAAARRGDAAGERLAEFREAHLTPALRAVEERLPTGVRAERVRQGFLVLRYEWEKSVFGLAVLIAAAIIWWNWRLPPPPPPTAAELALVRSFTARAPKQFDFSKLINLPKNLEK